MLYDLYYQEETRSWIDNIHENKISFISFDVLFLIFITMTITIGKSLGFLFDINDCN